jgi:hypothetical protein
MRGMCSSVPETNHVSTVYNVAAVMCLRFVLHVSVKCVLYFCVSASRSMSALLSSLLYVLSVHDFFLIYCTSHPFGSQNTFSNAHTVELSCHVSNLM